jgi:hypothetical protein
MPHDPSKLNTEATSAPIEPTVPDNSEFDALYNDPDLTPEKLNDKLNEYAKAYQQEFEMTVTETPADTEKLTRDFFKKNAASAAAQIVWLSSNADSETVRLNASKTVLTMAFEDAKNDGDPFKELLRGLSNNSSNKEPAPFVQ